MHEYILHFLVKLKLRLRVLLIDTKLMGCYPFKLWLYYLEKHYDLIQSRPH
jgi:hypothetical protein